MLNVIKCVQPIESSTHLHGVQPSQSGSPQHLQVLIASMNINIRCPELAGRLPKFLENWQKLTLDPPSGEGILHRIHHNSTAAPCTFRDTHIRSKVLSDSRGSDRAPIQRCYRGDPTAPRQLHLPDISGGEKGWGVPPSGEPQGTEPLYQTRALQDGRSPSPPLPYNREITW